MFRVGQKVVCVDDSRPRGYSLSGLTRGEVYVVARIGTSPWCGRPALWLVEKPEHDVGFWRQRFRPLVEKATDISIFTALLNPANHKHLEDV